MSKGVDFRGDPNKTPRMTNMELAKLVTHQVEEYKKVMEKMRIM